MNLFPIFLRPRTARFSQFLCLLLSCCLGAPLAVKAEDNGCPVIFSIGRLIGSSHFLEDPSRNDTLLSEYQLRLMKDRGSAPLGPETLPVDPALEKDFTIKIGMNAGLFDGGRYRSVGKVKSLSFQYREILSYFSFNVEGDGGNIDRSEGLYFLSEMPLPPVQAAAGHAVKLPSGTENYVQRYLLEHRYELSQLFLYEERNISQLPDKEILILLKAKVKLKTTRYEFQKQSVLLSEGSVGGETSFVIVEGRERTPKMFSKLIASFACGGRPHLYIRSWTPGSGAREDVVYLIEGGKLIPVFSELGWGV